MTASAKWRPCGANRWSACPTSLEEGGRSGPHELTSCISERSAHGGDFPGHDAPLKEIPVREPSRSRPGLSLRDPGRCHGGRTGAVRPGDLNAWSTVTGGFVDGAGLDAAYWVRNMCEPTLLEEGVRDLAGRGALRIIEISPHPVALYCVQQTLTALSDTRSAVLAASHRDLPPRHGLEDLAARLWCEGFDVNWSAVGAG
ncbi:acyltransferase domain-containing protein [Streptomyces massasporeus]